MAQNKDIILLDTDGTKLYPLAHKDSSKNVIDTTYLKKSGGTMTGPLIIEGTAASNPLIVRGISGSDGNGDLGDLYLNYNGGVTYFGTNGGGHITADGKSYSGNSSTATKATTANNFTVTNTNPSSLTNYYPVWVTGTAANTNYPPRVNNGFWYQSSEGTTSTVGESYLVVGNMTASGTAGNKRGTLALTASNSNYAYLRTDTLTGNRTLLLPDGNGTLVYTNSSNNVTSLPGNLSFANANIGVQRVGRSVSWYKGRDGALLKVTSLSGYSPTTSTKTTNGSWEIGAYDNSEYTDDLVFSYVKDTDYTNNTNNHVEIKFLEDGTVKANLQGNVTGNVNGNVTGDVTGNVTGSSSLNVLKAGDTMSGDLLFSNSGTSTRQVRFTVGDNDYGRVAAGAPASNAGWVELASADDGNEPIYVRQYTGAFTTVSRTLTLLDASGNTTIPGSLHLTSNNDAAGGSLGSPPLIIGTPTGQHLEIDNNEILSKSNGTTPSTLYLQDGTGGVVVAGSGGLNVNNGNLAVSGTITSTGGISATAGSIWAGTSGSTAAERRVGVQSGAGSIYLYSAAATNGGRGIWLLPHGTDTSGKNVLSVDTNNNTTFYGYLSGTASTATTATNATHIKIASGTTNKEYLTGVPEYSSTNQAPYINQYCYMQSNYLYSGGNKVEGHSSVWSGKKTSSGSDGGTSIPNLALFHRARIYAVYKGNGIAVWEADTSKIVSLNKECEINHTELSYMAWDGGSGYYQTFFKVSLTPSGNNMTLKFTEVRNFSVPYTGSTGTSQTGNSDYYIYQVDGIN